MAKPAGSLRVSVLAFPDAVESTVSGLCDSLQVFGVLRTLGYAVPDHRPFRVEVVGHVREMVSTTSGLPLRCHRTLEEVTATDIAIVPAFMLTGTQWRAGRYPAIVDWLSQMHARGAMICSACSGSLLLAETGLLDGHRATVHWAFEETFRSHFPRVELAVKEVLVVSGEREEFAMSGASASWHDLVLYLVARYVGADAAQAAAKFLLLQWHPDGQGPFLPFREKSDHGDAVVRDAQEWLRENLGAATPVEDMNRRSGLAERTFSRRFTRATGLSPIKYVQQLRIAEAKRQLEASSDPIDEIAWSVGYEDPAFFRRLFKRVTGVTPGAYRRRLQVPDSIRVARAD